MTRPRMRMTLALGHGTGARAPVPSIAGARPLDPPADREALARLLLDAYRGTVDDDGETETDALAAIDAFTAGEFGEVTPGWSEVVERDGRLVAATLVTTWQGVPLIAFSMTAPQARRQGLARGGLLRAMDRLRTTGEPRLDLVVTVANEPAVRLYAQLGFVPVPVVPEP